MPIVPHSVYHVVHVLNLGLCALSQIHIRHLGEIDIRFPMWHRLSGPIASPVDIAMRLRFYDMPVGLPPINTGHNSTSGGMRHG